VPDDDNDDVCLKTKCECYLPDRCALYGDIEVTVTDCQTDVTFCCTKRSLQLRVNVLNADLRTYFIHKHSKIVQNSTNKANKRYAGRTVCNRLQQKRTHNMTFRI